MSAAPLALTAGEPAGIGPDLCIALAHTPEARDLVVIGDPELLAERARLLDKPLRVVGPDGTADGRGRLRVAPCHFPRRDVLGRPHPDNAATLLAGLNDAVAGCRDGRYSGLVTAPLQKSVINDAGIPFSGHTEYLAELTGAAMPVMLLVGGGLRVALATTHLPLSAVPAALTAERLGAVIDVLYRDLRERFRIGAPRIRVCGLNPHAGEGGHLGHEDAAVIAPVLDERRQRGWRLDGPLPADTAFTGAADDADAVLAMYHDQGLPVLKYAGFGEAVNVTLGLPIVRTSVDHGTALDIAGRGSASPGSLLAAVRLARQLVAG